MFQQNHLPRLHCLEYDGEDSASMPTCMTKVDSTFLPNDLINDVVIYNLFRSMEPRPRMRVYLEEFAFDKVLNNKVIVDNMIIVVQKIQNI